MAKARMIPPLGTLIETPRELPPFEELMPLYEVAGLVGVSPDTVRRWTNRAEDPLACWAVGRSRFTTKAALAAFAKSNQDQPATSKV